MSYVLAFAGFAALIILHEFGHFAAAKAVGMRVERFSLFFGPLLVKVRRGETEYGIGPIPLGGYVKISGMNPMEELPDEIAPRSYYAQPVWKRVVVIAAGPAMNFLVAFLILGVFYLATGNPTEQATNVVGVVNKDTPAAAVLKPGDRIVSVDGATGVQREIDAIASHTCAVRPPVKGCRAATPAVLVVQRGQERLRLSIYPRYDLTPPARPRIGVAFNGETVYAPQNVIQAAGTSVSEMWYVTRTTVSTFGKLFVSAKARSQVNSVVGAYDETSQAFAFDLGAAAFVLAIISLSLAIVNLFPFLPLDGGHIFWALVEKVRGKPVSVAVMQQSSFVGIALVASVFLIGFTNDIHTLTNGGFHIR